MIQDRTSHCGTLIGAPKPSIKWYHFQWPRMTPTTDFKGAPLSNVSHKRYKLELQWNADRTYTHPTQCCSFEWPWVTQQKSQWHGASHGLLLQWNILGRFVFFTGKHRWVSWFLTAAHQHQLGYSLFSAIRGKHRPKQTLSANAPINKQVKRLKRDFISSAVALQSITT